MARARLTEVTNDLISDDGAVLWSLVRGEQLEFPVSLTFIENASDGYEYEAVVVEAKNAVDQTEPPTEVQPVSPSKTALNVRVLTDRGAWDALQAYNAEEIVSFGGLHYKLAEGAGRVSATEPDEDPLWEEHVPNKVYVQFPSTLASDWAQDPEVGVPVYGFFELRVTEPADAVYQRTWKPVRGMVEVLFSPTEVVP